MATTTPGARPSHHHRLNFEHFDDTVARLIGVDMRLIYGMAAPIFAILGMVIVLGLHPSEWLVGLIMLLEIACLGVVLTGIIGVMDNHDPDVDRHDD